MTEYGVWTNNDGGFVFTQCYSWIEAARDRARMIRETRPEDRADDRADLTVLAVCSEHEEQPAIGCEDCDTEDEGECPEGGDHDVPSDGSLRVCRNCGAEFIDEDEAER